MVNRNWNSLRLERLIETDYLANSDVTMPDNIKTWRQSLRDIPSNHTDEDAYDLLLDSSQKRKLKTQSSNTKLIAIIGGAIAAVFVGLFFSGVLDTETKLENYTRC